MKRLTSYITLSIALLGVSALQAMEKTTTALTAQDKVALELLRAKLVKLDKVAGESKALAQCISPEGLKHLKSEDPVTHAQLVALMNTEDLSVLTTLAEIEAQEEKEWFDLIKQILLIKNRVRTLQNSGLPLVRGGVNFGADSDVSEQGSGSGETEVLKLRKQQLELQKRTTILAMRRIERLSHKGMKEWEMLAKCQSDLAELERQEAEFDVEVPQAPF